MAAAVVLGATIVSAPGVSGSGVAAAEAVQAPAAPSHVTAISADNPDTAGVTLVDQPTWVGPNSLVSVTVKIAQPPPGAHLVTTLYDRLPSSRALQRSLFGEFGEAITPNGLTSDSLDPLPRNADGSVTATVSFAISDNPGKARSVLYVPNAGVYPLDVEAVGRSGVRVGRPLVTWIIRLPGPNSPSPGGHSPLGVALVLPLHAAPSHRPDGTVAVDASVRDRVRSLTQALAGAANAPLTVVPTPEVLDSLAASSLSADHDLLEQLKLLLAEPGRSVVGGTYVDVDLPAWLRQPSLRDRAAVEWSRGQQALQTRLGAAPLDATAVSPDDLTNDAVRWLHDQGVRQVLVSASAVKTGTELPTRPFTMSSGTGVSLDALAVNDIAQVGFAVDDSRRGLQETLAALAQTALDAPNGPQETVLAPRLDGDSWTADPRMLATLIKALTTTPGAASSPLVRLIPLADAFRLPHATEDPTDTTPVTVHATDADPESLADFDQRFATVQQQLASFQRMLATAPDAGATSNAGLARATTFDQLLGIAGSEELGVDDRGTFLDGISASLRDELASVAAPAHQTVTLTSRSGSIPFTVHNTLGFPVKVRLQMESSERLAFPDGTTQLLTLNGENTPVEIRIRARTSGDAPLTITVTSPDGSLLLATTDYTVRSTAVSGVGLALTIGAALVLVVWWVRSLRRGNKSKRKVSPSELPGPG